MEIGWRGLLPEENTSSTNGGVRLSQSIHVQENGSKLVNLIYRKVLQLGNDQCMCNNLVLHENG